MKLCTCNNCGNVYEDLNANKGQIEYPDSIIVDLLELIQKDGETFWGCPQCQDDAHLTDDLNEYAGESAKKLFNSINSINN